MSHKYEANTHVDGLPQSATSTVVKWRYQAWLHCMLLWTMDWHSFANDWRNMISHKVNLNTILCESTVTRPHTHVEILRDVVENRWPTRLNGLDEQGEHELSPVVSSLELHHLHEVIQQVVGTHEKASLCRQRESNVHNATVWLDIAHKPS